MARLLSIAATAVAASIAIVDGFTVTTRPVIAMDPTAPHQVLEQYYDVGQQQLADLLNHEALRTLKISVPGRVFVSVNYDFGSVPVGPNGPTQAATVRFSGNSEDIFKYFEVVSPAPHTLEVRRRPSVRGSLSDVYMLTEISLAQSQQISGILANGAGDIVIEDRVLVGDNQNDLKLQLSGSGDVFIDSTSSRLAASVEVASQGSGDIYWTTRSLQTSSLKLGLAGSGDFTWTSQMIDSTSAEIAMAGSGDVCVAASVINTNTMKASVVGSGSVSFSAQSGRCSNEEISVLGSGDILLGDIQCNDVNVALAASGDIYVQAVQSIYGSAFGSGDIRYVGVTPNKISDRRDKSAFSTRDKSKYKPIAKRADHNRISTCIVPPVPLREATLVTSAAFASGAVAFGPLIFFALISLCYLRSQRKPRRARGRGARFTPGAQATEMHPLMAAPPQQPYQPAQQLPYQQAYQQPYQPQRQQQQQQQQQQQKQNQVYV